MMESRCMHFLEDVELSILFVISWILLFYVSNVPEIALLNIILVDFIIYCLNVVFILLVVISCLILMFTLFGDALKVCLVFFNLLSSPSFFPFPFLLSFPPFPLSSLLSLSRSQRDQHQHLRPSL